MHLFDSTTTNTPKKSSHLSHPTRSRGLSTEPQSPAITPHICARQPPDPLCYNASAHIIDGRRQVSTPSTGKHTTGSSKSYVSWTRSSSQNSYINICQWERRHSTKLTRRRPSHAVPANFTNNRRCISYNVHSVAMLWNTSSTSPFCTSLPRSSLAQNSVGVSSRCCPASNQGYRAEICPIPQSQGTGA
jgi:hypothetical protein